MAFFSLIRDKIFPVRLSGRLDTVIRGCLLLAVFIAPVFWLPVNSQPLEINKTLLFAVIVLLAAGLYFLKVIVNRELKIVYSRFDWMVLAFFLFYLISFIFSRNHYFSLAGLSGYYSAGILSVACFIIFFRLLICSIRGTRDIFRLAAAFLAGSGLALVHGLFQANGVYLLPWPAAKIDGFNLAAAAPVFGVVAGVGLLVSFGIFLNAKNKRQKISSGIFIFLSLAMIFFLGSSVISYLLAACFFIFLIIASLRSKQLPSLWVIMPTILLTVVVLFIFLGPADSAFSQRPALDHRTSAAIGWQSFLAAPFSGSGPQTFHYDFAAYRPAAFNDTAFWNLSFIKGSNEWFGLLATIGAGGSVALLAIGFYFSLKILNSLKLVGANWGWQLTLLSVWLLVFLSSFFMPFSFIGHFLWWLILAGGLKLISFSGGVFKEKKYSFSGSPAGSLVFSIIFLAVLIGAGLTIFFGARVWLADYHFARAQTAIEKNEDLGTILARMEKSAALNPYEPSYALGLAQGYATQALILAEQEETEISRLQSTAQKIIDNLKLATAADPDNPYVYQTAAVLYDSLRSIIGNVDELAVEAYSQAAELAPTDPLIRLNLGRARLMLAESVLSANEDQQSADEARSIIELAIEDFSVSRGLKKDFAVADYNLGLAYRLSGEDDLALAAWQRAINDSPGLIEPRWQRALVYEEIGEIEKAVNELEAALKIDPDNGEILNKLEQLTVK